MLGMGVGNGNGGIPLGGGGGERSAHAGAKATPALSGLLSREVRGEATREISCVKGFVARMFLL